ncbi:hypothetical protein [Bradyrhizobium sp. McL0616]|uniref:hypothetical protein n=1 Tax=Bradyrhizobium sp. McL0616 TaxID=3415674 RepID=UPI003CEC8A18
MNETAVATTDLPLDILAATIKARVEAADKSAEKAADHYRAAGLQLVEAKKRIAETGGKFADFVYECGIGRSRAYELIGIANGTKTVAGIRATVAERVARHADKNRKARKSVSNGWEKECAENRAMCAEADAERLQAEVERLMEESRLLLAENERLLSERADDANADVAINDDGGPIVSYFDRGAEHLVRTEFSIEFRQQLAFSGCGDEPEAQQPARYLTPVDFRAAGALLGVLAAKEAIKKMRARKKQEKRDRKCYSAAA